MGTSSPSSAARQLAPFIVLAILLHAVPLYFLRKATTLPAPAPPIPALEITIAPAFSPATGRPHVSDHTFTPTPQVLTDILPAMPSDTNEIPLAGILDEALTIARTAARTSEQQDALRKQQHTPLVSLQQFLSQPHTEVRLANGMLKIITEAGEVCFQDVPYFAADARYVFGIPSTCP